MIEILRNSFIHHMNCIDCCNGDDEMYSTVLKEIELSGMAPPYHSTKGYEAAESHGTGTLTHYRKRFREWDEENE